MKTTKTASTTAKVEQVNAQSGAKYVERMQINKNLLVSNLSKLYKDLRTGTLIPREVLEIAKDSAIFNEFRAYMIARHKLNDGEQPTRGWSVWYALEWCEKQIKLAAQDENAPTHAKAIAYLKAKKIDMQNKAAKMY